MTFPLPIPPEVRGLLPAGTGVLLGLSGGVDSAVTLALLRALDCEVQGVTFKNFCFRDSQDEATEKSCCSLDAIADARRQAHACGASHWVADIEAPFSAAVIDPFVREYAAGRTPNPCLECNGAVRFPELVRLAERQGCSFAATGHYARVLDHAAGPGRCSLRRGLDAAKDQSYFLHRLPRELLPRLVFPLGWYTKDQVRAAARELGIAVAEKPDSQEICFVPDGDRGPLFAGDAAGALEPGDIVDTGGRVLGRHRGLVHYTVGQRRGLGVAAPEPLYVLRIETETARLVVGPREDLAVTRLAGDRLTEMAGDLPRTWASATGTGDEPVLLRIRHRHGGAAVRSWRMADDRLEVDLAEAAYGAAPGQGMVLYRGDRVLAGARILEAE